MAYGYPERRSQFYFRSTKDNNDDKSTNFRRRKTTVIVTTTTTTTYFQISFIFAAKTTILLTSLYVTIIVLKRKIDENKRWYIYKVHGIKMVGPKLHCCWCIRYIISVFVNSCSLLVLAAGFLNLIFYVSYIHPVSRKLYSKQMAIHINQISKQVYTDYHNIKRHILLLVIP